MYNNLLTWNSILGFLCFIMLEPEVLSTDQCIRRVCSADSGLLACNGSLILISDVTRRLKRDDVALENMKRACMGKMECDPTRVCTTRDMQTLVIHYFCVDEREILAKSCTRHVETVRGSSGYLQSPSYPGVTRFYLPCRWRIEPPPDSVVVLTIHDVATNGSKDQCDGGLMVSGYACDGEGHAFAPRLLCGADQLPRLMRCGKVGIELSPSKRVYPLRFWLSFHVHPKSQPSNLQVSPLPCSGWLYSMNEGSFGSNSKPGTVDTTGIPAVLSDHTNTKLLIIMLSIISGISAILFIILIVVCVRCRLLRETNSEHVYSEPSPALQAHYEYISSLESDKPRPQLADGYFEVADALPACQRGEQPASPAYAEVEQFAPLRKRPWIVQSKIDTKRLNKAREDETGSRASAEISDWSSSGATDSVIKSDENSRGKNRDVTLNAKVKENNKESGNECNRPKRGVLDILKGDKFGKNVERGKKPFGYSQSTEESKLDTKGVKQLQSVNKVPDSCSLDKEDNSSATYEQIEFPTQSAIQTAAYQKSLPSQKDTSYKSSPKGAVENRVNNKTVPSGTGKVKSMAENCNKRTVTHETTQPFPRNLEHKPSNNEASAKSNVILGKNTNNNGKPLPRALPRAQGIVKNGILKFEQNDAIA